LFVEPKQTTKPQNNNIATDNSINGIHIVASDGTEIQAIYLAPQNGGEISDADLKITLRFLKLLILKR